MLHRSFARAQQIANRLRGEGRAGVRAEKKQETGSLYIYAPIGASFWGDAISAQDVAEKLEGLKGVKTLDVFVNSEGGDVFDGKAIYNALKRFDAEKTVHVDGIAASIASVISMAGDHIITGAGATWMIHDPWGFAVGTSADMRATADVLDKERENIIDIYAARTKASRDELRSWMAAETWMNAEEAKERGFTDEVLEPEEDAEDAAAASNSKIAAALRETQERILAATPSQVLVAKMQQRTLSRRASPSAAGQPARK